MKQSDQAEVIAKQHISRSTPRSFLGIVSPCSVCLNQRANYEDGKPACPRRVQAVQKAERDSLGSTDYIADIATLTGSKSGELDDGTKALTNPVYDNSNNIIFIWCAALKDNRPISDSNGSIVSPDILDSSFSSDWLFCKSLPFIPKDTEAQYFQAGCLMEGDQVELSISHDHQVIGNTDGTSTTLPILGTVRKINVYGEFPRQSVSKDLCPSGT